MKRLYIKPQLTSIRIGSKTMLAASIEVNRNYRTREQFSKKFGGLVEDDFESNDGNNQFGF